jgi:hypothetical protein
MGFYSLWVLNSNTKKKVLGGTVSLELSTVSSGYDLSTINANFEAIEAA